ncbi:hypothetical protein CDAR_377771 [Caerostris darwini]|uniref:Uncharacterized protein n=1 Tax=Caerostris darwini TaxID=1538125 RepID=A0AAV4TVV4_9ARAC|nr:hypothetical protein CDAR_377771 [Caerostris darwini]
MEGAFTERPWSPVSPRSGDKVFMTDALQRPKSFQLPLKGKLFDFGEIELYGRAPSEGEKERMAPSLLPNRQVALATRQPPASVLDKTSDEETQLKTAVDTEKWMSHGVDLGYKKPDDVRHAHQTVLNLEEEIKRLQQTDCKNLSFKMIPKPFFIYNRKNSLLLPSIPYENSQRLDLLLNVEKLY